MRGPHQTGRILLKSGTNPGCKGLLAINDPVETPGTIG